MAATKASASRTPTPAPAPAEEEPKLSYEQARDELIAVVNRLESGGESLAQSMELYQRGQYLAGLCEAYLSEARTIVEETVAKGESTTQ